MRRGEGGRHLRHMAGKREGALPSVIFPKPVIEISNLHITLSFCKTFLQLKGRGRLMAGGFAKDGDSVQQMQDTVNDLLQQARNKLGRGESLKYCLECGEEIPEKRRLAVKGCKYCINCQNELDGKNRIDVSYGQSRGRYHNLK